MPTLNLHGADIAYDEAGSGHPLLLVHAGIADRHMWDPVWALLTPEASQQIRKGNYERLFDAARAKVRAWEKVNVKTPTN